MDRVSRLSGIIFSGMAGRGAGGFRRRGFRCRATRTLTILGLAVVLLLAWSATAYAASASVVYHGSTARKQIALTFDDNTNSSRGVATLRALQKYKVRATMFVIGQGVKAYPSINNEIVKGMAAGLFEVGDHSWSHPVLTKLSTSGMRSQIGGGTDAFREATGARTVPLFRPPYGSTNSTVAAVAGSEGFSHLVLWDIDPRDWAGGSAKAITDHIVSRAHNGAIVVMHLSAPHTYEAIPGLATRLRDKGYELVTVSEMLKGDRLFLDVSSESESGQAIVRMVDLGFMSGYNANYFGPWDSITRAQVAKVSTLVGGIHTDTVEGADAPVFADVPVRHDSQGAPVSYPFDFVQEAAAAGLVVGSAAGDGTMVFRPNEAITRVQFATILARMARQFKGYPATATDAGLAEVTFPDVPAYAAADVSLVATLGLMTGSGSGSARSFQPWSGAVRAQVAVAMSRYLDLAPYAAPSAAEDPPQSADPPVNQSLPEGAAAE